jgi:hypothetical protein
MKLIQMLLTRPVKSIENGWLQIKKRHHKGVLKDPTGEIVPAEHAGNVSVNCHG